MIEPRSPVRPLVVLVGASLFVLSACEVGPSVEETPPPQPKVRKLYAPGAGPSADEARASDDLARPVVSPEEEAALQAALLGTGKKADEAEAEAEEARKETRRPRRRRRAEPDPVDEPDPLYEDPTPGQLSDSAFQAAITDWRGMKRCLASNAGRLPSRSGALRVAFTIRGDGHVARSEVVETSNDVARAIAPCVERRARRIRFPSFAAASDQIEKTAKFVF